MDVVFLSDCVAQSVVLDDFIIRPIGHSHKKARGNFFASFTYKNPERGVPGLLSE
jgi:hypothetical protein